MERTTSMSPLSQVHFFFNQFCSDESAIINNEGALIFLKCKNPLNVATLNICAQNAIKYLPLKIGDIALLNDPYSGGTTLNEYTFITKILETSAQTLYWVQRIKHGSLKAGPFASVEEEGLRIPPTPVFQNKKMNTVIIQAMGMHPLCPRDFAVWLEKTCLTISQKALQFSSLLEAHKINLNKQSIDHYLQATGQLVLHKITESGQGDCQQEVRLSDGELLRLHLEVHDGKIKIDFSGTTTSQSAYLTETVVYSILLMGLAKHYQFEDMINSSSFGILQVTKPTQCMLNAKYPMSISKGTVHLKAAILTALQKCLLHIHNSKTPAAGYDTTYLQFENLQGEILHIDVPAGGTQIKNQMNTVFAQDCFLHEDFSIEKIELNWPLSFEKVDVRLASESKAENGLGLGAAFTVRCTGPIELTWACENMRTSSRQQKTPDKCSPSEIHLQNSQGVVTTLAAHGRLKLNHGDLLSVGSSIGSLIKK